MKKRVLSLMNLSNTYRLFVAVGMLMVLFTAVKLSGLAQFSSDWFWLVAGMGITIEGLILLTKQKMFDKKYKVVLRESAKKK